MTDILERGDVFFFYRPRVHEAGAPTDVEGPGDVQRLYMILRPRDAKTFRRIVIGRKRLPELSGEREWGFVESVETRAEDARAELGPERYQTRTRGERVLPRARPAGEGVYALARHGDHTHLAYALELPRAPGEVQEALEIRDEASYIVTVKNPEAPSPPGMGRSAAQEVRLPESLQKRFRGRRFAEADPELLDQEGVEIVLIGTDEDAGELGLELDRERETLDSAEIFRELELDREKSPIAPLIEGEWE